MRTASATNTRGCTVHNGATSFLYNSATDLYKADAMDIPQILPQNKAMAAFLDEQFNF
jgi:hypothetical protein